MKFYSFDDIRQHGDCLRFVAEVLNLPIQGGRCQAAWRGGDGFNVALETYRWCDHRTDTGGGLLELCAVAKFAGDKQQAQAFLGEWLGLEPKSKTARIDTGGKKTRYEELIETGFAEVCRYHYVDLSGATVHTVIRMKNETTGEKQFLQRTPTHWGLGSVAPILYNLPEWSASPWVCVPEGEKDVETLRSWGMPATTNCGGATHWRDEYNVQFAGKDVAILIDNDEPGREHGQVVSRALAGIANSVKVICVSSLPKGDVTDWAEKEGGTAAALIDIISAAPREEAKPMDPAVKEAKELNQKPFSNTEVKDTVFADGSFKKVSAAKKMNDMIDECHRRFLGFPRKIGNDQLFDHDRDTHRIEYLQRPSSLFAWVQRKSKQTVEWGRLAGCTTKEEMFEGLIAEAHRYEAVSYVPDWPRRSDVYYAHQEIPAPSLTHAYFDEFIQFFSPAGDANRTLLKAFICAPIFYRDCVPRPCWILDSQAGPGVGKTTAVEILGMLYSCSPIRTSKQELKTDIQELVKRLVSSEGRNSRLLLVDNVSGTFAVPEFADLVTARSISGKAPYGRGEESRPNNLTYVITANSANLDNDIACRSFYIDFCRPASDPTWKQRIMDFLDCHRMQVFADILDILEKHKPFPDCNPVSRFPEFETEILQAVCADMEEYEAACRAIIEARADSNVEEEGAKCIEEMLRYKLVDLGCFPDSRRVFIRSQVVDGWLAELPRGDHRMDIQTVRNLAKSGIIRNVSPLIKRFPSKKEKRRNGIMWIGPDCDRNEPIEVIGLNREGRPEVVDKHMPGEGEIGNEFKRRSEDI
jgi:hypothetical protein